MGMTEQRLEETALRVSQEMCLALNDDEAIELVRGVIAALPKPDAVAYMTKRGAVYAGKHFGPTDTPLYTEATIATHASEQDQVPTWIVVHRQGFCPVRKGPLVDFKHTEEMLRELYELNPDCICTVMAFDHTEWPEDGREWLSIYGDGRRKKPTPAPDYKTQFGKLLALVVEARATLEMWKDVAPAVSLCADLDAAIASAKGAA